MSMETRGSPHAPNLSSSARRQVTDICQTFPCQNFQMPNSPNFSPTKLSRYTVICICTINIEWLQTKLLERAPKLLLISVTIAFKWLTLQTLQMFIILIV